MNKRPANDPDKNERDFVANPPRLPKRRNVHGLVQDSIPDSIQKSKPKKCTAKNSSAGMPPVLDPVDIATLIALSKTEPYKTSNLLLFSGKTEGARNFTGS